MRSDLVRGSGQDSRTRECSNGDPPCAYAVAPGVNPLGLCDGHLEAHNARCGIVAPAVCSACDPLLVTIAGQLRPVVGAMCFACGVATGGTVASPSHRHEARGKMRARMLVLSRAGDRGPEWAALLARCPEEIRAAFERRLAVSPTS